jgi:hypothetical protein
MVTKRKFCPGVALKKLRNHKLICLEILLDFYTGSDESLGIPLCAIWRAVYSSGNRQSLDAKGLCVNTTQAP